MRTRCQPDFTAQRAGTREWPFVVTSTKLAERNTGVLDLDIGSGNACRFAAEAAARRNALVLSRRIWLDYDGSLTMSGFLLLLPVYAPAVVPEDETAR
jgi:hypothetical protein